MGFLHFSLQDNAMKGRQARKFQISHSFSLQKNHRLKGQNNYLFGLFQSLPTIGSHSCSMSFHQNLPSRLSFRVPSLFNLSQQGWLPSVVSQVNAMLKTERTVNQREVQNMTQIPCGPCFIVGEAFGSTKKSVDFLDFGIEPCMDILPT